MDVSVIIVNYNTVDLTIQCVESVYRYTHGNTIEVIVVDNGPYDESLKRHLQSFPTIKYLFNKVNSGFGCANNIGIKISKGKYIFLLNSDTFLISDAISSFYQFMELHNNADVACCGASLIDINGNPQISYGNFPSLLEAISSLGFKYLYPSYFAKALSSGLKVSSATPHRVDYVSGADMFVRRSALDQTGPFDEDFFLYFEETELSFRFRKFGYKSIILPEIKIVHIEGASSTADAGSKRSLYNSSRAIYFKKCHGQFVSKISWFIYKLQDCLYYFYAKAVRFR
ncbi:glycosyltransferase family 2 protein [Pedobacter sp. JY14-1]|uniref:glycosyltransferase family 2 protein n=1 Tax=Pedobacter sp. JY14-1 TaxID=3034151 RepID=UPI0023E2C5CA|nr:glycosyltransferase family 2 protein [Pedobacter sp. JY14-1]